MSKSFLTKVTANTQVCADDHKTVVTKIRAGEKVSKGGKKVSTLFIRLKDSTLQAPQSLTTRRFVAI